MLHHFYQICMQWVSGYLAIIINESNYCLKLVYCFSIELSIKHYVTHQCSFKSINQQIGHTPKNMKIAF